MPNDRVQRFRLSGDELQNLPKHWSGSMGLLAGFSGCDFMVLGGNCAKCGSPAAARCRKIYSVATTEATMRDHVMKNFLAGRIIERYDGNCVWNCWKTILKQLEYLTVTF